MVARDHDPNATANAALGGEHGGNTDQPSIELPAPLVDPAESVKSDDKVKDDKPKPGPSGPGLRTTNAPTRRGR